MRIRLTRKLALMVDGVDLTNRRVGEVFEASAGDARTLIAEGWATLADEGRRGRAVHAKRPPADTVADRPRRTRRH
jgi:hypothetical protein